MTVQTALIQSQYQNFKEDEMKIAKQLALAALVGSLVATSAMAYGGPRDGSGPKMDKQSRFDKSMDYRAKCNMRGQKGGMFGLYNIDLTPEQMHEVRLLRAQMQVDRIKANDPANRPMLKAFSDGEFDKEVFVKIQVDKAKQNAELKATYIEKLYNILTPEQRKQWIKNMELAPKRR